MKQSRSFFTALLIIAATMFAASCNNGDEKTSSTETVKTDSPATKTTEPATPAKPRNIVTIKHKVADFAKWKLAYDADDTARVAYGLHNYVVSRGLKDSSMVMVALIMDDVNKAKEFAARPALKTIMQKAGVIGAPAIFYNDIQFFDTSVAVGPDRVSIRHSVKDWAAWKKEFDSHKQARMDAGLVDRVVSHEIGDDKQVSVVCGIADMKKAEAFISSKDLKDKMAAAGVVGMPDIFFYKIVQRY